MNANRSIPLLALLFALVTAQAAAHCQIPCGIYDDAARFTLMLENVTTIEKSMNQITELSAVESNPNWNQLVRWVENKETHANELTETVTYYFMAQRVKPADPADEAAYGKYIRELTLLHTMVVHCMKAKQTTDLAHVARLRTLIQKFRDSYLGAHEH